MLAQEKCAVMMFTGGAGQAKELRAMVESGTTFSSRSVSCPNNQDQCQQPHSGGLLGGEIRWANLATLQSKSHPPPPNKQWPSWAEEQHWRGSKASSTPDPVLAQRGLNKLPYQWSLVQGATHSSPSEKSSFALVTYHPHPALACREPQFS